MQAAVFTAAFSLVPSQKIFSSKKNTAAFFTV